jgi:hypothetical protein
VTIEDVHNESQRRQAEWDRSLPPEPADGRLFIVVAAVDSQIGPVVRHLEPEPATPLAKRACWLPNKEWVLRFLFGAETQIGDVAVWYGRAVIVRHR